MLCFKPFVELGLLWLPQHGSELIKSFIRDYSFARMSALSLPSTLVYPGTYYIRSPYFLWTVSNKFGPIVSIIVEVDIGQGDRPYGWLTVS